MFTQKVLSNYKDFPVDITSRVYQNNQLQKVIDNNIRLVSAAIVLRHKAKLGDVIEIEEQEYKVIEVEDSLGIKWLSISPCSQK